MKIKRRYVKAIYIDSFYCEQCNEKIKSAGEVLCSYPERYVYFCPMCKRKYTFYRNEIPNQLKYEYEDEVIDIDEEI